MDTKQKNPEERFTRGIPVGESAEGEKRPVSSRVISTLGHSISLVHSDSRMQVLQDSRQLLL